MAKIFDKYAGFIFLEFSLDDGVTHGHKKNSKNFTKKNYNKIFTISRNFTKKNNFIKIFSQFLTILQKILHGRRKLR